MSRSTVDLQAVRFFLGYGLIFIMQSALTILIVAVVMLAVNPLLALVALAPTPFLIWVAFRYGIRNRPAQQEVQQRIAELTADAEENVTGVRVVKAFAQEARQFARFRDTVGRVFSQAIVTTRLNAFYTPLIGFLPQVGLAAVLLIGGSQAINGTITVGEFVAFYGYVVMLAAPPAALGIALGMSQRAVHRRLPGLRRRHDDAALTLADRRDEVDDPGHHVARLGRVLEHEPFVGEQRRQVLEARPVPRCLGIETVDGVDLEQRWVLLVASRRPAEPGDLVALAQAVLAGELDRDVGVVAARQVTVDAKEAVALLAHVEVAADLDRLVADRFLDFGQIAVVALRTFLATLPLAAPTAAAISAVAVLLANRHTAPITRTSRTRLSLTLLAATLLAGPLLAALLAGALLSATLARCALARVGATIDGSLTDRTGRW